jgi:hypothetical protein
VNAEQASKRAQHATPAATTQLEWATGKIMFNAKSGTDKDENGHYKYAPKLGTTRSSNPVPSSEESCKLSAPHIDAPRPIGWTPNCSSGVLRWPWETGPL